MFMCKAEVSKFFCWCQQCLTLAAPGAGVADVVGGGGQSSLLQSVHRIWPRSGKKPEPTSDTEQREHLKHGWCHCRSSKETYFPSPNPVRHNT